MTAENRRVLIVDDDEHLLLGLARAHRRHFLMATAQSGQEGLAMLREDGPFAVIVADLHMPQMDGLQLLEAVRAEFPETRRIMLTGDEDLEIGERAVNSGLVTLYLVKPCPEHAFREAVELSIAEYGSRA